ncbi:MAG TPA: hypothetical protein VJJ76_00885 [archaeon]|nr:hypothetical protein [archaeon]
MSDKDIVEIPKGNIGKDLVRILGEVAKYSLERQGYRVRSFDYEKSIATPDNSNNGRILVGKGFATYGKGTEGGKLIERTIAIFAASDLNSNYLEERDRIGLDLPSKPPSLQLIIEIESENSLNRLVFPFNPNEKLYSKYGRRAKTLVDRVTHLLAKK